MLKELAQEAINVQDACNPLGVTFHLGEMMPKLREALQAAGEDADTYSLCKHPIFRLWASKVHDLAGMGLSNQERYSEAYRACQALAGDTD